MVRERVYAQTCKIANMPLKQKMGINAFSVGIRFGKCLQSCEGFKGPLIGNHTL